MSYDHVNPCGDFIKKKPEYPPSETRRWLPCFNFAEGAFEWESVFNQLECLPKTEPLLCRAAIKASLAPRRRAFAVVSPLQRQIAAGARSMMTITAIFDALSGMKSRSPPTSSRCVLRLLRTLRMKKIGIYIRIGQLRLSKLRSVCIIWLSRSPGVLLTVSWTFCFARTVAEKRNCSEDAT